MILRDGKVDLRPAGQVDGPGGRGRVGRVVVEGLGDGAVGVVHVEVVRCGSSSPRKSQVVAGLESSSGGVDGQVGNDGRGQGEDGRGGGEKALQRDSGPKAGGRGQSAVDVDAGNRQAV